MNRLRTTLAAAGVPGAFAVTLALLFETWRDRLPDPIAVHWQNGAPNGTADAAVFVPIVLAVTAVLLIASSLLFTWRPHRLGVGMASGIISLLPAAAGTALAANLDVGDWHQADNFLLVLTAPIGCALAAGLLGVLIAPKGTKPARVAGPSIGLRPGERATWSGGARNRYLPWLALATPLTLLGKDLPGYAYPLITAAVALAFFAVSRLRVRVDDNGVTIRMAVFRRQLPLDRILGADVAEVSFFTGLGHRVNPLTGTTAYKVRGGEALRVDLKTGRSVFVTVDRPKEAAGLLNDLLDRRTASPGTGSAARP